MKTYKIIFKGRVQGVGFRYTARNIAKRLNLDGTVKNLENGDVEVYIYADEDSLDKFVLELKNQGFIRIDSADIKELDDDINQKGFEILYWWLLINLLFKIYLLYDYKK